MLTIKKINPVKRWRIQFISFDCDVGSLFIGAAIVLGYHGRGTPITGTIEYCEKVTI